VIPLVERAEPIRIGVRELRGKLAYYLREAKKGQRFLIVSRGGPMAELGPPFSAMAD
jgi:prevent-host-death family protein